MDCSFKDGNFGCDGGSLQAALRYVARDGLIRETYYPYIGQVSEDFDICDASSCRHFV